MSWHANADMTVMRRNNPDTCLQHGEGLQVVQCILDRLGQRGDQRGRRALRSSSLASASLACP